MSGEPALERSVLERKERDELHTIAEALGVKPGSRTRKADLIDQILQVAGVEVASDNGTPNGEVAAAVQAEETDKADKTDTTDIAPPEGDAESPRGAGDANRDRPVGPQPHDGVNEAGNRRTRRRRGRDRDRDRDVQAQEKGADQQYQGEPVPVAGLLDLAEPGYGFIRTGGYLPSQNDVYVSMSQVRKFALRSGDYIDGTSRPALGNEKYGALLRVELVSGMTADEARRRPRFEDLTPLFPDEKLKMELPGDPANVTARIIDLISPIGKGQRGMIVSPPKAGKTTVIKHIVKSIEGNNPEVHLMVLLVDERPEEVTDMRRSTTGEVISSTFDRPSDEHTQVAELALDRAKRLVEQQRDVVIIMDGITRLARAYNLSAPASGRLTSGGIDQAAIYPPKRFFGAARNIEEGGSLTILATALIETGSKADDVIFEEFKGTGNMELRLDRKLAERRLYPAIDVNASSTRHEELLFDRRSLELTWRLRRVLNGLAEDGTAARSLELLIEKIKVTKSNEEFLHEIAKAQGAL
jgi:transcription termination factor Rho